MQNKVECEEEARTGAKINKRGKKEEEGRGKSKEGKFRRRGGTGREWKNNREKNKATRP